MLGKSKLFSVLIQIAQLDDRPVVAMCLQGLHVVKALQYKQVTLLIVGVLLGLNYFLDS